MSFLPLQGKGFKLTLNDPLVLRFETDLLKLWLIRENIEVDE